MATMTVGDVREPEWRTAIAAALKELGARRLWHASNGDVQLAWYLVRFRLVRIEWDVWTGLRLSGPPRHVTRLASAVRPFAVVAQAI